eukprot:967006-Rhodomonas_salina.1
MEFPQASVELEGALYAGVSSFGFGGTNAHVVLGAAPEGTKAPAPPAIEWDRTSFPWQTSSHPFLGTCKKDDNTMVWTCEWDSGIVEYLSDHRVRDVSLVPA